jgi:NAD(P)-dependent dehydrogenase (short-subunit alcohol dehydrogenase family)
LLGFTRAAALDFAHLDITPNAVTTSLIDTDLAVPDMSEDQRRDVLATIAAGRLGTPDDVAAVIAFLCTSEPGDATGEVLDINGGSRIDQSESSDASSAPSSGWRSRTRTSTMRFSRTDSTRSS